MEYEFSAVTKERIRDAMQAGEREADSGYVVRRNGYRRCHCGFSTFSQAEFAAHLSHPH